MAAWVGVTLSGDLGHGDSVRLIGQGASGEADLVPGSKDRMTFVAGQVLDCKVVEVAPSHVVLEWNDRHLLIVRTGDNAEGNDVWEVAASREAT